MEAETGPAPVRRLGLRWDTATRAVGGAQFPELAATIPSRFSVRVRVAGAGQCPLWSGLSLLGCFWKTPRSPPGP